MKIAMIASSLFNQGAEYVVASLARGLASRGHQVDIFLSKYHEIWQREHPDWEPFELPSEVHVVILPVCRGRQMIGCFRKMIKSGVYDVILGHSPNYSLPLAIASIGLRRTTKLIHVCHSGGVGVDDEGRKTLPPKTLATIIHNWLMRRLDALFAVSTGTANALVETMGYPRDRVFVVYNPVIDRVFSRKLMCEPDHPWFQDTVPIVVAAGAFQPCKNHLMLIRAFADVVRRAQARLIIYGKGPLREAYEKEISHFNLSDVVALPGQTNNLPAAMRRARCLVVSSVVESFSIVCVEALAAGTLVVSTNCPYGPPEILKGGEYGILVENKNQQALTEGILKVLNGGGVKPTPEMWAPYTVEATVERYERAINFVMERGRN